MTDEHEREFDLDSIHQKIENILLNKDVNFYRRFSDDVVSLVFHSPENFIQVETIRRWIFDIENAVEDAIRDALDDFESEIAFTFVKAKK